jgi:hypothetical protein
MSGPLGAYGFGLSCPQAGELPNLIPQDPRAPEVTVTWRHASTVRDIEDVDEDRVAYGFRGATTYYVERHPHAIRFDIPYVPSPAALVHPLLTIGVSVLARWRGDVTLHAGAFQTPRGGWGVMGAREAGKSSLLATLGERGHPILADDLLAVHDGAIRAGPSCVDLRPDTVGRFPDATSMGIIGGRPRFRLATPPGDDRVPLRGFFVLDWGSDSTIRVEPLGARERLEWLYRQEYIRLVGDPDPEKLLPLLPLPGWRLLRPRDWVASGEVIERVLAVTEDSSPGTEE